jgi:hypothetical protein
LRYRNEDGVIHLQWAPNPRGERPVRYEVYGSDEKGFSVHKDQHEVPGRGKVPANFLGETSESTMIVVSPTATHTNANRTFYRVVAVDAHGTQSGCSDFLELPHPFVYTRPPSTIRVGVPYQYEVKTLKSLGDYQCRQDPAVQTKKYAYRFWDSEHCEFQLETAHDWLSLDTESGLLQGTPGPDDVATSSVTITVTNQFGGTYEQAYGLKVVP